MKVNFFEGRDDDNAAHIRIEIDSKSVIYVHSLSECSEDATLERDLNFVYDIPALMKQAYDAGVRGESFEIERLPDVAW